MRRSPPRDPAESAPCVESCQQRSRTDPPGSAGPRRSRAEQAWPGAGPRARRGSALVDERRPGPGGHLLVAQAVAVALQERISAWRTRRSIIAAATTATFTVSADVAGERQTSAPFKVEVKAAAAPGVEQTGEEKPAPEPPAVRRMIGRGEIEAYLVAGRWLIPRESLPTERPLPHPSLRPRPRSRPDGHFAEIAREMDAA